MKFTNENIIAQTGRFLGNLEIGIEKMQGGYTGFGDDIESIIAYEERFPQMGESPTGDTDLRNMMTGNSWNDAMGKPILGTPFSNEEWTQLFTSTHYPFPDAYREDNRVIDAVIAAQDIQKEVLMSGLYQAGVSEISKLSKLSKDNFDNPRGDYVNKLLAEHGGVDFDNMNIGIILGSANRRLTQIIYSIEEAKNLEKIIDQIGNPMSEVKREILDHIAGGGEFDCLCIDTQ